MTYRGPNRPQNLSTRNFITTLVADTAQTVNIPNGVRTAVFSVSTSDALSVALDVTIDTSPSASAGTQVATFDEITGATSITLADFNSGTQEVSFTESKSEDDLTGLSADVAGTQAADFDVTLSRNKATGFSKNDNTVLQTVIDIDGAGDLTITYRAGDLLTFGDVVNEINRLHSGLRASLVADDLIITSLSQGASSTILIDPTAGTGSTLLLALADFNQIDSANDGSSTTYTATLNVDGADTAGFQVVDVGGAKAGGTATGLANDATVFTATIDVDDAASPQAISIVGSAAQTYTTLIAELDADTTGATWSIVAGNLRATSDLTGLGSAIDLVDTDLFAALTDFVAIDAPVDGSDDFTISIVGNNAQTFATLLSEINNDISGAAVALVAGNLLFTSDSTLTTSAIDLTDVDLFAALNNFSAVEAASAATQIDYEMTVAIDGNAPTAVSLNATDFSTYTELAVDIDAAIGGAGAATTVVGSTLTTVSDTTGAASSIEIVDANLLSSIAEFLQLEASVLGNIAQANFIQNPVALNVASASTIDIESAGTPVVHISFYG